MSKPIGEVFLRSSVRGLATQVEKALASSSVSSLRNIQVSELTPHAYKTCEVVLADPPLLAPDVASIPNLKFVQSTFAGVDSLVAKGMPNGYKLCKAQDVFGKDMAAYVMGHVIRHFRFFPEMEASQSGGRWDNSAGRYSPLSEYTMAILGAGGSIASEVAKAAGVFGLQSVGLVSRPDADAPTDITTDHLSQVLEEADIVVNLLPSTGSTRGMLSGEAFSKAKRRPLFINVGRGDIIETTSLITALERGWIAHAVLDVFETEPLPEGHPFWTHPNITVTPHIAAVSHAKPSAHLFVRNMERLVEGEPLLFPVDWAKGY